MFYLVPQYKFISLQVQYFDSLVEISFFQLLLREKKWNTNYFRTFLFHMTESIVPKAN